MLKFVSTFYNNNHYHYYDYGVHSNVDYFLRLLFVFRLFFTIVFIFLNYFQFFLSCAGCYYICFLLTLFEFGTFLVHFLKLLLIGGVMPAKL